MEQENYIVYVRMDGQGRILEANSSVFLTDTTGWTAIDEGLGDKYHHAQGNYFDGGLYTDDGIPRYKLADGAPVLRSDEEIDADRQPDLETVRAAKIAEMSAACNAAINAGTPVQMPDGTQEAFTYSTADQANVSDMFMACLMGADSYPYTAIDEAFMS